METNKTYLTEVVLLGFSNDARVNTVLFFVFFLIYVITFFGNLLMICTIIIYTKLHTPMYYFLCILSFVDMCTSTTVVPRLLTDLFSGQRIISYVACGIQFYIIIFMGGTECILLAIMAYDRYIAICRPLHYPILMRWSVCYGLTVFLVMSTFLVFLFPTLISQVPLCNPNQINHFMCEILALMALSCYHVHSDEFMVLVVCFISMLLPFVFILFTYFKIISSVLNIRSAQKSKAFSTCSSHITVVLLYYGSVMVMNFGATSPYTKSQGKYISMFYLIICPMLNPVIYGLNNAEVKEKIKNKNLVSVFLGHHNS